MNFKIQANAIEHFYHLNKRDLIFRQNKDPYRVWVSEVMAQQTQIVTMLPYYMRWMDKYPTVVDLANADINDVLGLWAGLGYYNRAKNLVKGAKQIVKEYNGIFPTTKEELLNISGIGNYIAGAIASICFDQKVSAIDGNVNRVVSRLLCLQQTQGTSSFARCVEQQVQDWLAYATPSILNQALMELGALVCKPKQPLCSKCPLQKWCLGQQCWQDYPIKKRKKANPIFIYNVSILIKDNMIALAKPAYEDGLMDGYYRFPYQPAYLDAAKLSIKHIYSHLTWICQLDNELSFNDDQLMWVPLKDLNTTYHLIKAHEKLLAKFNSQ